MSFTQRLWLTAAFMLVTAPVLVFGALRSMDDMHNSPIRWMPESFPARATYTKLVANFESNSTVAFSWPGLRWDDPVIDKVVRNLKSASDTASQPFLARVITAQGLIETATERDSANVDPNKLVDKLRGTLVGPEKVVDGKPVSAACLVLVLTPAGEDARQATLDTVLDVTAKTAGVDLDAIRIVGPPVDAALIDKMSLDSFRWFAAPSMLLVLILSRICLRNWAFTIAVFFAAGYGQILALAGVYFLSLPMNAVIIVMPPLVMVLAVSAGVHLVNYYHDEVAQHGAEGAAARAVKNGFVPCFLAAATTAVGLLSLLMSDITPIKVFGFLSAMSMLVSVALLFLLLPGCMQLWPVTQPPLSNSWRSRWNVSRLLESFFGKSSPQAGIHLGPSLVTVLFLAAMVFAGFGLLWLKTSVSVQALFAKDSKILTDYAWFEENIGPMVPVEVVVTFDKDCPLNPLDRLTLIKNLEAKLQEFPAVDAVYSGATFLPVPPPPGGIFATTERTLIGRGLSAAIPELVESNYLNTTGGIQAWRISGRVSSIGDIDYGAQLAELEQTLDPYLQQNLEYLVAARKLSGYQPTAKSLGVSTLYTGIMSVTYEAQNALLNDLFNSFMTALVIITCVMILLLRSVVAGLLTMLPNLLPTTVLFGCTSWLGIPLDIGGVMTASVALGIAVDDTLHFVTWYRRERIHTSSQQAVVISLRRCAGAMLQTTLICSLGMSVYMLAEFIPTQRFSVMLVTLLIAAILGDLVMLPAMLLSPLGRFFRSSKSVASTQARVKQPSATA